METSLFERLGGRAGIERLADEVLALHMENPTVGARFRPYLETPDKITVIKTHLCTFLEAGTGGTAAYQGRDMRTAHRGMNISAEEYMAVLDDIMTAMKKCGLDDTTQHDLLAIGYSLKGEIIRV